MFFSDTDMTSSNQTRMHAKCCPKTQAPPDDAADTPRKQSTQHAHVEMTYSAITYKVVAVTSIHHQHLHHTTKDTHIHLCFRPAMTGRCRFKKTTHTSKSTQNDKEKNTNREKPTSLNVSLRFPGPSSAPARISVKVSSFSSVDKLEPLIPASPLLLPIGIDAAAADGRGGSLLSGFVDGVPISPAARSLGGLGVCQPWTDKE